MDIEKIDLTSSFHLDGSTLHLEGQVIHQSIWIFENQHHFLPDLGIIDLLQNDIQARLPREDTLLLIGIHPLRPMDRLKTMLPNPIEIMTFQSALFSYIQAQAISHQPSLLLYQGDGS